MSIEALIQAHTEALLANTEALKLLTLSLAGRTPTAEKPKANKVEDSSKAGITGKTADKVIVDEISAAEAGKTAVNVEEGIDATAAVPYETVRALVLKLAPTQRDAIKALNAKHGIANLKVLLDKEDDFSTVNDQVKLEAVYVDLQALEG
ncbi:MAG: hypothetical protein [Bacteriophage sp.]|nr:MAG: hypothetical protein [Bacteriophage sp.]